MGGVVWWVSHSVILGCGWCVWAGRVAGMKRDESLFMPVERVSVRSVVDSLLSGEDETGRMVVRADGGFRAYYGFLVSRPALGSGGSGGVLNCPGGCYSLVSFLDTLRWFFDTDLTAVEDGFAWSHLFIPMVGHQAGSPAGSLGFWWKHGFEFGARPDLVGVRLMSEGETSMAFSIGTINRVEGEAARGVYVGEVSSGGNGVSVLVPALDGGVVCYGLGSD